MASVEGLAKVQGLIQGTNDQLDQQAKMDAAKQAAELFKGGDIKGALSTILQHDPDRAAQLVQQFQAYDPSTQQDAAAGKERGGLLAQTEAGANPRQMLDTQLAAQKEIAQMKANKEPSAREQRLSNNFNQSMAFKYQQSAESSPIYKSAISVINEMPQLKSLLDDAYKNGGQSLAMLGPRIAKGLAGEVGVLTEQDVTRYITNPALARSILSKGEKAFEGKLTQTDYGNLMRLGTVMEKNAQAKMEKAYNQAATKLSRNLHIPMDEARLLVDPNIDEQSKSIMAEPHATRLDPANEEALIWISKNPNDPRVPAIKAKLGIK